jgi:hypothetical protein
MTTLAARYLGDQRLHRTGCAMGSPPITFRGPCLLAQPCRSQIVGQPPRQRLRRQRSAMLMSSSSSGGGGSSSDLDYEVPEQQQPAAVALARGMVPPKRSVADVIDWVINLPWQVMGIWLVVGLFAVQAKDFFGVSAPSQLCETLMRGMASCHTIWVAHRTMAGAFVHFPAIAVEHRVHQPLHTLSPTCVTALLQPTSPMLLSGRN